MPVYIDNYNAPFGRMIMCHMIADSTEELCAMADRMGVQKKWIQYPGDANEHFDVCKSAKALGIAAGAIEITAREYARAVQYRRIKGILPDNIEPLKLNTLF